MELNVALEAIKNKYKDLGLGDKILTGFASKIAKTATEETLAQLVEDIEPELQIWQSVLDSHRKEKSDLKKQVKPAEAKKEVKPKEVQEPEQPKDEAPEWAKALISEVQGLKADKLMTSRRSQYESIYKDVKDEKFKANQLAKFDRMNFKDDDDFNSFIETEANDVKDFNQSQANENLKGNPPMSGINGKSKPSESEIKEVMSFMA